LLIVGCGDIARRAIPLLTPRWRIIALVRNIDVSLRQSGVIQLRGDLDVPESLRRLGGIAHAVLYSAPPPPEGEGDPRTRRLLAALNRRAMLPRRLIYISTTGVYGDCQGARVPETRPLAPRSERARRRVDAEKQLRRFGTRHGLRSRHCRVSILRAPGIYAAGRLPLARLLRGDPVLHADEDSYTNHIHAEDLARACVAALKRGRANRAYHISDDSALKMADWFDKLADAFGLPHPPRISRLEAQTRLSPLLLSFMNESRRIDNTRMKRELKLRLAYPTTDSALQPRGTLPCSG